MVKREMLLNLIQVFISKKLCQLQKEFGVSQRNHDLYHIEEGNISRRNLNEYIGTLHLAPTQFCLNPDSHRKTLFLSDSSFSLTSILIW